MNEVADGKHEIIQSETGGGLLGSLEIKTKRRIPVVVPRLTDEPGDYALGSLESRVAARARLERIEADRKKNLDVVKIEFRGFGVGDRILEFYEPKKDRNR